MVSQQPKLHQEVTCWTQDKYNYRKAFQEKFLVTRLESFLLMLLQQCKHVDILETKDEWRRFAPPFFLSPHQSKQTLKKRYRALEVKSQEGLLLSAVSNSCRTQLRSHRKYYEYHYWETSKLVCTMVIAQSLQRFAVWLHQQERTNSKQVFLVHNMQPKIWGGAWLQPHSQATQDFISQLWRKLGSGLGMRLAWQHMLVF